MTPPVDAPWVAVHLELAGRAGLTLPDVGLSRAFTLPRARLEGDLGAGDLASARLAVAAVRSAGDEGYIGIDGEAIVPEVQLAEARVDVTRWGLAAAAGITDDPWVASADAAWGLRDVAPTFGEDQGWMDSGDLGGWVAWTAPRDVFSLRVDLTSGEGFRYRERNEGKDLAGTVTIRPVSALALTAYAREGSRGLGLARDHRAGARVSGGWTRLTLGVEGLAAWGVDGDAERAPLGGSAWATARPWGPLLVFVRADLASEALSDAEATSFRGFAGAGVELRGVVRVLVGYEGTRVGDDVAELSGAADLEDTDTVYLQLGVRLGASTR